MRSDELIDNVASDLTVMTPRPALRERVMAVIVDAPQMPQHGWLGPAMAAAAGVAIATWLVMPTRVADEAEVATTGRQEVATETPRSETAEPRTERIAEAATPVETARHAEANRSVQRVSPTPVAVASAWTDMSAEIRTLPPLAGPPPIVIEPIAWNEVTIAPIEVDLIEVKALVIEPLAASDLSGV